MTPARWEVGAIGWAVTRPDTVSTFGSFSGPFKWWEAALAPNGSIYCAPSNATSVLKIDPSTDTVSTFGSFSGSYS